MAMGIDVEAEEIFSGVRDQAVAEGGDADGADVADEYNDNKRRFLAVQAKEGGGGNGAEQDMAGVEDVEQDKTGVLPDVTKQDHESDAQQGAQQCERGMVFQGEQDIPGFPAGEHGIFLGTQGYELDPVVSDYSGFGRHCKYVSRSVLGLGDGAVVFNNDCGP